MSIVKIKNKEVSGTLQTTDCAQTLPINHFIMAANPLFDFIQTAPDLYAADLHATLKPKLNQFRKSIRAHHDENIALISGYMLCFALDALIQHKTQHKDTQSLVTNFFHLNKTNSLKRLLTLTETLCKTHDIDTSLLEFIYFCMNLSTPYIDDSSMKTRVTKLMEELYQKIYPANGTKKHRLKLKKACNKVVKKTKARTMPLWLTTLIATVGLFTVFSVMTFFYTFTEKQTLDTIHTTQSAP